MTNQRQVAYVFFIFGIMFYNYIMALHHHPFRGE